MKRATKHLPLETHIRQFITEKKLIKPQNKIIIAVSGGIDSVVMLDIIARMRSMMKLEVIVAHVNHLLRGKESNGDEQFVRMLAQQYNMQCYVERVPTKKITKKKKNSLQVVAREIRYSFFETLKKSMNAAYIATAHNADDNAETVLMNLIRGTGVEGLAGIPISRGSIIRPLLHATRKEITEYARKRSLKFRNDSSNFKDDYSRNYLRHKIIPNILKELNPSFIRTLSEESEIFRANIQYITSVVERIYSTIVHENSNSASILIHVLNEQDIFVRHMVVRTMLENMNIEPSYNSIVSIVNLAEKQRGKVVEIHKHWVAERQKNTISIYERQIEKKISFVLSREGTISNDYFEFSIKQSGMPDNTTVPDSFNEYVDASLIRFPITVRSWKSGDVFIPLGMKGKKKVSDFFVDHKLSNEQKKQVPIIESNNAIVWVGGYRLDERFKLTNSTKTIYHLSLTMHDGKKKYHY